MCLKLSLNIIFKSSEFSAPVTFITFYQCTRILSMTLAKTFVYDSKVLGSAVSLWIFYCINGNTNVLKRPYKSTSPMQGNYSTSQIRHCTVLVSTGEWHHKGSIKGLVETNRGGVRGEIQIHTVKLQYSVATGDTYFLQLAVLAGGQH